MEVIKQLPSASPDLSEEDMRLIKKLRSFHNGSYAVVLDKLITSACNKTKQQATGSSDCISRQDAIVNMAFAIWHYPNELYTSLNCFENCQELAERALNPMPSAESVKAYTKADYIMALHKEYGCTLTMAEEAHNKALEHLRSKARMKG